MVSTLILVVLLVVQFGLAHSSVCSQVMAPRDSAGHCSEEPAEPNSCPGMGECGLICQTGHDTPVDLKKTPKAAQLDSSAVAGLEPLTLDVPCRNSLFRLSQSDRLSIPNEPLFLATHSLLI